MYDQIAEQFYRKQKWSIKKADQLKKQPRNQHQYGRSYTNSRLMRRQLHYLHKYVYNSLISSQSHLTQGILMNVNETEKYTYRNVGMEFTAAINRVQC